MTVQPAHTPGPWHLTPEVHKRIVFAADGYAVADTTVYHTAHGEDAKAAMEANARLIAAAPDLLEALERIATVDMGGGFLGAQACREVARAAITKARGR